MQCVLEPTQRIIGSETSKRCESYYYRYLGCGFGPFARYPARMTVWESESGLCFMIGGMTPYFEVWAMQRLA